MANGAGRFVRVEPRSTARAFVAGPLLDVERKNSWSLAEHCGHRRPDAMQRPLRAARWDAEAVRDDLRDLVVERLGDPDGVLIVDETGFLKKGEHSARVQRQYSAPPDESRTLRSGCSSPTRPDAGALIDRRLHLPKDGWCADESRRAAVGTPEQTVFATKPHLARDMIAAALDAGTPARWVTGDEVYGQDPSLRAGCRPQFPQHSTTSVGNYVRRKRRSWGST
ncbi:IS701 family transposase [Streptomyces sp. NPDC056544]|uniref:IS701 family transposase n=1 Tax=unclassified Streptomyces TaxID=2593676 RepID=UPI0036A339E1